MRRFLIPIILFAAISWGALFFLLNFTSPYERITNNESLITSNKTIAAFLISLFFATLFTLTFTLYFFYRLIGDYLEPRFTLRRALRHGFLAALGLTTVAILQLTKTANPLTLTLTLAIVIALEFSFRATR